MDSAFAATTLLPFLKRCSVSASVEDLSALDSFRLLLADANRSFNLTRVLDEHGFWIKHVADSFSIGIIRPSL